MTIIARTLSEFDEELRSLNLFGQWNAEAQLAKLTDGPKPSGTPYVWQYDVVRAKLNEACLLFPESLTARRNVTFVTPGLQRRGSTETIIMGMQLVLPGEVAQAHRHSIEALRFVVEGNSDLTTVVNGDQLTMERNDLILTPAFSWHDHHNRGSAPGVWLDVLNVPLIAALNLPFYEPYDQPVQELASETPSGRAIRYPWRDIEERLASISYESAHPSTGARLRYTNPGTGGDIMPSLAAHAQLLPPGFFGEVHRTTASEIYYVIDGTGSATIGEKTIEWNAKDAFAVPAWARHRFRNASESKPAILFCVSDEPLVASLGLFREEHRLKNSGSAG